MDRNIVGVVASFIYFFGLLVVQRYLPLKELEHKRKFVHIMLGNWWFFVLYFFDNVVFALITPVAFIFINYISLKRGNENGLLSSLEREEASFGIIAFPIAMSLLVILSFCYFNDIRIGGVGMLALSYGDGVAALAGKRFKYKEFSVCGNKKSVSGSIGMLLSTAVVVLLYLKYVYSLSIEASFIYSMQISCLATVAEAITPLGIDDISVPLVSVFVFNILSYING